MFALNVRSEGFGIDGEAADDNLPSQATEIVDATDGDIFHNVGTYEEIKAALCKAFASPLG